VLRLKYIYAVLEKPLMMNFIDAIMSKAVSNVFGLRTTYLEKSNVQGNYNRS
jgi:cytochrome c oxidase subunit IV